VVVQIISLTITYCKGLDCIVSSDLVFGFCNWIDFYVFPLVQLEILLLFVYTGFCCQYGQCDFTSTSVRRRIPCLTPCLTLKHLMKMMKVEDKKK